MTQTRIRRTQAQVPVKIGGGGEREGWLMEELHDGVTQSLWYLGIELSALYQDISPELGGLREQVETLGRVAQEAYQQLRETMKQAQSMDGSGRTLGDVVQEQVQVFEERTEVEVQLTLSGEGLPVPPWKAHHLAAILREALWNTWRHAGGQQVQVGLNTRKGAVVLTVADGGPGFVMSGPSEGHYGLATMQKRAEALGGTLQINSTLGNGTRVLLTFPAKG